MPDTNTEETLCPACSKTISTGDKAVCVHIGIIRKKDKQFSPKETWGTMHVPCFMVAIGDPDSLDFLVA